MMRVRSWWQASVMLAGFIGCLSRPGGAAELQNPPDMRRDADGRFELTARQGTYTITGGGAPIRVDTRSFAQTADGPLVGPTLRIRGGDTLKLHLRNELTYDPAQGDAFMSDTLPHGFDVLNVHYHGLHVTPVSPGDNVLLNVYPKDTTDEELAACKHEVHDDAEHRHVCFAGDYDYSFELPGDHTAGTYWYHPHKHGAVAMHLASGLAGALIIEDPAHGLDSLAAVKAAAEKVVVINEIMYRDPGTTGGVNVVDCLGVYGFMSACRYDPPLPPPPPDPPAANVKLSVNGQFNPTITLRTGEAQVWRVLNAAVGNVVPFCLVPMPGTAAPAPSLFVLGVDGIPVQRPASVDGAADLPIALKAPVYDLSGAAAASDAVTNEIGLLAPGQRLDLMVQGAAQPGYYVLLQPDPSAQQQPTMDQLCATPTQALIDGAAWDRQVVMYVDVVAPGTGDAYNKDVPTQAQLNALRRPTPLADAEDRPPAPTQGVVFGFSSQTFSPATNGASTVNGRPFNLQRTQRFLKLDQMDLWSVQSASDAHMFHIHINPFQVFQRGNVAFAFPVWRDTALVNCNSATSGCSFPAA
ncbi:copper oxidase [Oleomonas cavernae]|uniref:Copper oxidase n=1 Tax=Oleomonas cavernae TaxID=2320859 RepID=A0A418WBD9_9PROT|nr:multicopper oxidase domain-containing protein [Oleomonas cavernae]RJF87357.1 copper oxidase [Oleomonas cavernae]